MRRASGRAPARRRDPSARKPARTRRREPLFVDRELRGPTCAGGPGTIPREPSPRARRRIPMPALPVRREGSADLGLAIALAIALSALAPAAAPAPAPEAVEEPADPAADPDEPARDPAQPADPAAPSAPAPPVRRVGEVTAHATRGEREVLDVPGNVTVIDREEIERSGVR